MIRRFLSALICLSMLLGALVIYDEAEYAEKKKHATAAAELGLTVKISVQAGADDPAVFWPLLEKAASQSGVNVVRKADGFNADNNPFVSYYVYLASDETKFFDSFRLREGRFMSPSETREGSVYLSSLPEDDESQVGIIDDIGRNDCCNIYGMEKLFESYKASGEYVIESSDIQSVQEFYEIFSASFDGIGAAVDMTEVYEEAGNAPIWGYEESFVHKAVWLAVLASVVMILYRQVIESKRTAILLLYGSGYLQVWYSVTGRLIIKVSSLCLASILLIALLIPGITIELAVSMLVRSLAIAALLVAASFATLVLIGRLNIQEALKGRRDTLLLAVGSMTVKGCLSLVLLYMGAVTIGQYESAQQERAFWGDWQQTSQYGVFYPMSVGNDGSGSDYDSRERIVFDLYPVFNSSGSLYVESQDYAYYAIHDGRSGYRSITVNPNYLDAYPVRDDAGDEVSVSEGEDEWVLLVPESLRDEENEITEFYARQRSGENSAWALDETVFGRTVENPQLDQDIKIVWIASGQRVFSFNPEVNPDDGNCVTDPIIEVMTINNSSGMDREACILGSVGDALKVKLDDGGSAQTYERYVSLLQECGLDDNLKQLVTMDEMVFSQLQGIDEAMMRYAFQMGMIFMLFLVLVLQSVPLLFELDARRTAVKKLHGYAFVSRNRFFFSVFTLNWIVLLATSLVFNNVLGWPWGDYGSQDAMAVIVVAGVFLTLEAAISIFVLSLVERRRVVDALKEGY